MNERIFLGYDRPFIFPLVEWLLSDSSSLAQTLIIVPTAQSGRTLREQLALKAGAMLAPTVATPGSLLHMDSLEIAPPWIERAVWDDVLHSISAKDWQNYTGLFPTLSAEERSDQNWAGALAHEIVSIRKDLQEHSHSLFTASKFLGDTPDAERWTDLAKLEDQFENALWKIGLISKTAALRNGLKLPSGFHGIILAGVTEIPACLRAAIEAYGCPVKIVIPAPEADSSRFNEFGIPLEDWVKIKLPTSAKLALCANPREQSKYAIEQIAEMEVSSEEVALGSGDEAVSVFLEKDLTAASWSAFNPAMPDIRSPLAHWLCIWMLWIKEPSSRHLLSLLSLPSSSVFTGENRAAIARQINQIRDKRPAIEPESIIGFLTTRDDQGDAELKSSIENLLTAREQFLKQKPLPAIEQLIGKISLITPLNDEETKQLDAFKAGLQQLEQSIQRPTDFWLRSFMDELPKPLQKPPEDRVLDIQGWLELLYEPGAHLIITGMNEGFVPPPLSNHLWLSEGVRKALGINNAAERHARDAFLLHAMIHMRIAEGSAELIAGKTGSGGEAYLPSRLLLNVEREHLTKTVKTLFRGIEPPESNLLWERDWAWKTPTAAPLEKISVTSLKDYLSCPFRFYLKHLVKARDTEPDRREMNHRDFGSIIHDVLEIWGNDSEANILTDASTLSEYLIEKLSKKIEQTFGFHPPIAVRIQVESMEQRFRWFAEEQVKLAVEGWRMIKIEEEFKISSSGLMVSGKIDRIDRHQETGQIRVIDYKTGESKPAESAHRKKLTKASKPPTHLAEGGPAFFEKTLKSGKAQINQWFDLQLPVYALAIFQENPSELATPAYFNLGKTRTDVCLMPWKGFTEDDLESAKDCLDWITQKVSSGAFWPPQEKVEYDYLESLVSDKKFSSAFTEPPAHTM